MSSTSPTMSPKNEWDSAIHYKFEETVARLEEQQRQRNQQLRALMEQWSEWSWMLYE
jgi:hypothetical protein